MKHYLTYDADQAMFQLVQTTDIEGWAIGRGWASAEDICADRITKRQYDEYAGHYGLWWTMAAV